MVTVCVRGDLLKVFLYSTVSILRLRMPCPRSRPLALLSGPRTLGSPMYGSSCFERLCRDQVPRKPNTLSGGVCLKSYSGSLVSFEASSSLKGYWAPWQHIPDRWIVLQEALLQAGRTTFPPERGLAEVRGEVGLDAPADGQRGRHRRLASTRFEKT